MAELVASDVTTPATTQNLLDAALAAARRYCGWSVSPVVTVTGLTLDGPGGRALSLPTLNLLDVTAVTEDGITVDVANLRWSRQRGTLYKHGFGCWTTHAGGIVITFRHGFTEAEAADWRRAIVRLVDVMSTELTGEREDPQLSRKKVDDVEYEWFATLISTNDRLASLFSQFRILPSP
jgi:hypothetical protein